MIIRIAGREIEGNVQTRNNDTAWEGRESKAITAEMSYADALALFENNVPWSVVVDVIDEYGETQRVETDTSEYAIAGPITDNRDGTVTARMGKYRKDELMQVAIKAAPANYAEAQNWRGIIEEAVQSVEDDMVALAAAPLYPKWEDLVGRNAPEGMRFQHDGKLYKVRSEHSFAAEWIPGAGTESLYTRIDEAHAGTADNPIPYAGNMALEFGKYYSQDGAVYLCNRDTVNPVHDALSELAGIYVEAVG